jgi:hypothetical protein
MLQVLSSTHMMQVGKHDYTHEDVRVDVSCTSHHVNTAARVKKTPVESCEL